MSFYGKKKKRLPSLNIWFRQIRYSTFKASTGQLLWYNPYGIHMAQLSICSLLFRVIWIYINSDMQRYIVWYHNPKISLANMKFVSFKSYVLWGHLVILLSIILIVQPTHMELSSTRTMLISEREDEKLKFSSRRDTHQFCLYCIYQN